jgi:hypothetical protein
MATITLTLTYPDAEVSAILDDLRWTYGQVIDATTQQMRDRTSAELVALVKSGWKQSLIDQCRKARKERAQVAIVVTDPSIS